MPESIDQTITRLSAFIQGVNPSADISPGSALSELLVKLAATLLNDQYNTISTLSQASSVQAVLAETTPTITIGPIDAVASNYRVLRATGTFATGNLKIILSTNQNVVIPDNAQFVQSNLNLTYNTTQQYTYSANANTTNGYLPIISQNGTFFITVPVQASEVGSSYQVSDQTQFTLGSNYTNNNVVTISAYGNFSSGLPEDTDQALVAKFQAGTASVDLTTQAGINTYLTNNFPGFQSVIVIGAGDPEMTRCKENLFGIATNGMADVYVRTSVGSSTITVAVSAIKTANGIWTATLSNSVCPGFYSIKGILPTPISGVINSAGSLVINSVTYGFSQLNNTRNNQINSVSDARFSCYQTANVVFQFSETPAVNIGDTLNFDFTFFYQPNLLPIQQVFLDQSTGAPCGDYLVRGVIPAFTTIQMTLKALNSTDTPSSVGIPQLMQNIYNYINTIPSGFSLAASELISMAMTLPIQRVELPIVMTGNIYTLTGGNEIITSGDELVIPTDLPNGISSNVCQFFIDYFSSPAGNVTPNNNIIINLV